MSVKGIPEGYHTITPYFSVRDAPELIEFLKNAFDAVEVETHKMPDGTILNSQVRVGDSMVLIGQAAKDKKLIASAMLYMYVEDADAVYRKAVEAGAKSIREPSDQYYGDRSGAVEDPAGNQWWIAAHKEEMSGDELIERAVQNRK